MNENKDKEWLKKILLKKEDGKKKKNTAFYYFVILFCIGVAFMILSNFFQTGKQHHQAAYERAEEEKVETVFGQRSAEPNSMEDYENRYEKQLQEALEQIVGVRNVTVMVNVADTEKKIYEKNVSVKKQVTDESDREGGRRSVDDTTREEQIVIVRNGDKEEPLIVTTKKPEIRGVLVVAEGVENLQVKSMVIEAVSRVLDVPSHKVSVQPKKKKEE